MGCFPRGEPLPPGGSDFLKPGRGFYLAATLRKKNVSGVNKYTRVSETGVSRTSLLQRYNGYPGFRPRIPNAPGGLRKPFPKGRTFLYPPLFRSGKNPPVAGIGRIISGSLKGRKRPVMERDRLLISAKGGTGKTSITSSFSILGGRELVVG